MANAGKDDNASQVRRLSILIFSKFKYQQHFSDFKDPSVICFNFQVISEVLNNIANISRVTALRVSDHKHKDF